MKKFSVFIKNYGIVLVLVAICLLWAVLSPSFFTGNNLLLVVKQVTLYGILAVGMTYVIVAGGIDLSVGAIVALSGVCAAKFATEQYLNAPLIIPIVIAVIVGLLVGVLNGVGIAYLKIPNFIMTMCTMQIVRGVALVITNGKPIFGMREEFIQMANGFAFRQYDSNGDIAVSGIPNLVFYFVVVMVIGIILLQFSTYGRKVYSVGGNMEASRYSGVNVKWIQCTTYIISGLLAGLVGVLMASRISSGNATTAEGYEMNAIAGAVIGGTSMSGGVGTIFGTMIGVLIIGAIGNGMDILGISSYYQQIIKGFIILLAVFLDSGVNKKQ